VIRKPAQGNASYGLDDRDTGRRGRSCFRRVAFLTGGITLLLGIVAHGLLAVPLAAEVQQPGKVYRVGNLSSLDGPTVNEAAFWEKLRELGWIEGKHITVENRFRRRLERWECSSRSWRCAAPRT
jgi:hypothetical protein